VERNRAERRDEKSSEERFDFHRWCFD
jgi:hypothetical protein